MQIAARFLEPVTMEKHAGVAQHLLLLHVPISSVIRASQGDAVWGILRMVVILLEDTIVAKMDIVRQTMVHQMQTALHHCGQQ